MAEPFTSDELADLRARHERGRAFGTSLGTELRLLDVARFDPDEVSP